MTTEIKPNYLPPNLPPWKNPRLAVLIIVLRKVGDKVQVLLTRRWTPPGKDQFGLPGNFHTPFKMMFVEKRLTKIQIGNFIAHQEPEDEVIRLLKLETNIEGDRESVKLVDVEGTNKKNGGDERDDHVVRFVYIVRVPEEQFVKKPTKVLKLLSEDDGKSKWVEELRSNLEQRVHPSQAYWYPLDLIPGWNQLRVPLSESWEQEKVKLSNMAREGKVVDLVYDQVNVFRSFRSWCWWNAVGISVEKEFVTVVKEEDQPLIRGNSALTVDIIVIRQIRNDQQAKRSCDKTTPPATTRERANERSAAAARFGDAAVAATMRELGMTPKSTYYSCGHKFQIALIERGAPPFTGKKALPGLLKPCFHDAPNN